MNRKQLAFIFGVWLCVYPLVTGFLYILRSLDLTLPIAVQTLILTLIIVPIMVQWIVPFVKRWSE